MSSDRDRVLVTTVVAVDTPTAFEVFTTDVDSWWKHGKRFRTGERGRSRMQFEPGVGGRLLEVFDESADPFVVGRIAAWDPPSRLILEMGGAHLQPGETTKVEVRFTSEADGTRVTIEHRGWDAFGADHPVRRGLDGGAFAATMGVFWGDLLVSLRAATRSRD